MGRVDLGPISIAAAIEVEDQITPRIIIVCQNQDSLRRLMELLLEYFESTGRRRFDVAYDATFQDYVRTIGRFTLRIETDRSSLNIEVDGVDRSIFDEVSLHLQSHAMYQLAFTATASHDEHVVHKADIIIDGNRHIGVRQPEP